MWEPELALREPAALDKARLDLRDQIECNKFIQFEFDRQWSELKAHCERNGIRVMGDVPIYVAQDSSDVWAAPEMFDLEADGKPRVIAGVPPDYFSATGQCWGNPIYRWDVHAKTGFQWWIARFRRAFEMLDLIRLDHFRGFEAYYEIPGTATTAVDGRWVKGPGAALFEAVEAALGNLPILAENLGVITPEVEGLRNRFGFPGMAILQFAFGKDPQAPDFKPHNYPRHRVAYTGTHDNDTVVGWWSSTGAGDSTRTAEDVEKEMEFARRYLNTDGSEIHWAMIRTLMASVADTVIFPLQDVLGIGSEGRMNLPGTSSGNWHWRYRAEELPIGIAATATATGSNLRPLAGETTDSTSSSSSHPRRSHSFSSRPRRRHSCCQSLALRSPLLGKLAVFFAHACRFPLAPATRWCISDSGWPCPLLGRGSLSAENRQLGSLTAPLTPLFVLFYV